MLPKPGFRWIGGLLPVVALGAALVQTLPPAITIIASPDFLSKRHTIKKAAEVIAADIRPGDTVFALKHDLIYWYLDRRLLSRIILPSTFAHRPTRAALAAAGYAGQDELGRILAARPTYLVTKLHRNGSPVPVYARGDEYAVHDLLADHYRLFYDTSSLSPPGEPTLIYKLREERDAGGASESKDSCVGRATPGSLAASDTRGTQLTR